MEQDDPGKDLLRRFQVWLPGHEPQRSDFFTHGLVVLDANVLLHPYRLSQMAREDLFRTLERIASEGRLWIPHQTATEFFRKRQDVVNGLLNRFDDVRSDVRKQFGRAVEAVIAARTTVIRLIDEVDRDEVAKRELMQQISEDSLASLLIDVKRILLGQVDRTQDAYDIEPADLVGVDPILERLARIVGISVGDPLPWPQMYGLVRTATEFRYPLQIPPGFMDEKKEDKVRAAGDYLLWEEVIQFAETMPDPRLILLVTDEKKEDWRERGGTHPTLVHELWSRCGAHLRLEYSWAFVSGAQEFLNVRLSKAAPEEIRRLSPDEVEARLNAEAEAALAAESEEEAEPEPIVLPEIITAEVADNFDPQPFSGMALKSSGLITAAVRDAATNDRMVGWWLAGATVRLKLRKAIPEEPEVRLTAVIDADEPPGPDWSTIRLRVRSSTKTVWATPWFAGLVREAPAPDKSLLRRLAGELLALDDSGGLPHAMP
jgi:hypothetical protein